MLSYIYPVWMSELPADHTHSELRESPLSKPCYHTSTLSGYQNCLLISHTHSEVRESRLSKPCYHTSTLSGCQNCLLISHTQSWENQRLNKPCYHTSTLSGLLRLYFMDHQVNETFWQCFFLDFDIIPVWTAFWNILCFLSFRIK